MASKTSNNQNGHVQCSSSVQNGSLCSRTIDKSLLEDTRDVIPLSRAITTYISYAVLILWGYINDFLRTVGLKNDGVGKTTCEDVSFNKLFLMRFIV